MTCWGRPYGEVFELEDQHATGWRIEAIEEYCNVPYLRCLPGGRGAWSPRATCGLQGLFHANAPVRGCSCGYRMVRSRDELVEYWQRRKQDWFPGVAPALTRVVAAGRAQPVDNLDNLTNHNTLSVQFIKLAPGATLYTPAAQYAEVLRWRYGNVEVVEDFTELITRDPESPQ